MTIPDYQGNIGIAKKKLGLPEEQTEISEKSGLPEKSGISKTKIKTAKFSPTTLAGNMKVTIQRND